MTRSLTMRMLAAVCTAGAVVLTGCAGSVAGGALSGEGSGTGYAYGASQDEVLEAIADLPPVTLTYQPSEASPKLKEIESAPQWAQEISERSGGKITIKIVYGQAIAGYGEVFDALGDGRLDLAYTLPAYLPQEFPAAAAVGDLLSEADPSPFVGEMVANAASTEIGWGSQKVLEQYEKKGVYPLNPVSASGSYSSQCNTDGFGIDDYGGRQIRVGARSQVGYVKALGGTPLSLDYTETYEALQRKTIDCTLGQMVPSVEAGLFDVAPYTGYLTDTSAPRAVGAVIAGQRFGTLPLAYRQIIFDSYSGSFQGQMNRSIGANRLGVETIHTQGGKIEPLEKPLQDKLKAFNRELAGTVEEQGLLEEGTEKRFADVLEKWQKKAEELGYADGGDFGTMDEWYDRDTDYVPFGQAVYEEVILPHRPGGISGKEGAKS